MMNVYFHKHFKDGNIGIVASAGETRELAPRQFLDCIASGAIMSVVDRPNINMHGEHIASCLCCKYCDASLEEDLSDVTPGGWTYKCIKNMFDTATSFAHQHFGYGAVCEEFWPKT